MRRRRARRTCRRGRSPPGQAFLAAAPRWGPTSSTDRRRSRCRDRTPSPAAVSRAGPRGSRRPAVCGTRSPRRARRATVGEVVEDAEEEDDVKLAERLGRDVAEQLDVPGLDLRAQRPMRDVEGLAASPAALAPRRRIPAGRVDRDDPRGPAALGLEREEPVPRADVEHRKTVQARGQAQLAQLLGRPVLAGRDDAVAEVDRVKPAQLVDRCLQLLRGGRGAGGDAASMRISIWPIAHGPLRSCMYTEHVGSKSRRVMAVRTTPPFRADHVGSLLRPPELLQARADHEAGRIDADALRGVEDDAIRDVVALQDDVGLKGATDGELRRTSWHMDFIYSARRDHAGRGRGDRTSSSKRRAGEYDYAPPAMQVAGTVTLPETIFADAFTFLRDNADAGQTPKLTIPSPSMVHYRGGNSSIDARRLPRRRRVLGRPDGRLRRADRGRLRARLPLPAARRHVSLAYINDPAQREHIEAIGGDPDAPARAVHRQHQPRAGRPSRRPGDHHAPVPRQQPVDVGGRGRLRLRRRGAVQRPARSTATSSSSTTSAPARSSRCASCPRASRSCSAWSPPSARALEDKDMLKRRIEEASQVRRRRPAVPVAAVRVLLHRGGQQPDRDEQKAKLS